MSSLKDFFIPKTSKKYLQSVRMKENRNCRKVDAKFPTLLFSGLIELKVTLPYTCQEFLSTSFQSNIFYYLMFKMDLAIENILKKLYLKKKDVDIL